MKHEQFGKPIIAIVNSFTQFVPGHTHLHEIGGVKKEIEAMGCYAAEFNTIAVDNGIAMGHDGMLYSLPSRDIIAHSVEYMVNVSEANAIIAYSNSRPVTPGPAHGIYATEHSYRLLRWTYGSWSAGRVQTRLEFTL